MVGDDPTKSASEVNNTDEVKENTEAVVTNTASVKERSAAFLDLSKSQDIASQVGDVFTKGLNGAGDLLSKVSAKLKESAGGFALVSAATLGANKQFQELGKGSVDTGRLNTFTKQFEGLFGIMKNSPMAPLSKEFMEVARHLGATAAQMKGFGSATGESAALMGRAFLENADNILYAQNAIYQMAGSTGELLKMQDGIPGVLSAAGSSLENINKVGADYTAMLSRAHSATQQQQEEVVKWAGALAALPNGLAGIMTPIQMAGNSVDFLTAAMQVAKGAGMQQAEMMQLLTSATKQYGTSQEDALKFASRAADISNTIKGARIEDVSKALQHSAASFKDYVFGGADAVKMTQSLADANQEYIGQLVAGGVPAATAAEMAQNLTDKMHGLKTAQLAFLSQQSGGPGGLLGAFQMRQLMQKDPEAAMAKMQESIKKQLGGGPLMELKDVKTAADAAKMQKQDSIIQHGAMGMANSPEEAEMMASAMKQGKLKDFIKDKGKFGEEQQYKAGVDQTHQTETKFGQMQITAQEMQVAAGQVSLNMVQGALTGAIGQQGGINGTGAGISPDKDQIRNLSESASGRKGSLRDNTINDANKLITSIPSYSANAVQSIVESMGTGNETQNNTMSIPFNDKSQKAQADAAQMQRQMATMNLLSKAEGGVINDRYQPAGKQVGGVIKGIHTDDKTKSGTATQGGVISSARSNQPVPVTLVGGGITVNFTGKCPHCNSDIKTTASAASISPTATNNR